MTLESCVHQRVYSFDAVLSQKRLPCNCAAGHGQHLELPTRSMQMPCALVPTKNLVLAVKQDGQSCLAVCLSVLQQSSMALVSVRHEPMHTQQ
jgi:hypothetical protein